MWSKPVKPEHLQAAIHRFMGLRSVEQQGREGVAVGVIDLNILAGFREMEIEWEESILGKLIDVFTGEYLAGDRRSAQKRSPLG